MKAKLRNKRFIHVSTPPLLAVQMFGHEKAKEYFGALGTYRKSTAQVPDVRSDGE